MNERVLPCIYEDTRTAEKSLVRLALLLSLFAIATPPLLADQTSNPIDVRAGSLHRFEVISPAGAVAGQPFELTVRAFDAYGNLIRGADQPPGTFRVEARGHAQCKPAELTASHFAAGSATVEVLDRSSEITECIIVSDKGFVLGRSGEIPVAPAALDHFRVSAPSSVAADRPTVIRIEALDAFDNLVPQFGAGTQGVSLSTSGTGRLEPSLLHGDAFKGGIATARVLYTRAETMKIRVEAIGQRKWGESLEVRVMPGPLQQLKLSAPPVVTAGEAFQITAEVFDLYGNPIRNYSRIGTELNLSTSGEGVLTPSVVKSGAFDAGRATILCSTTKAETLILTLSTPLAAIAARSQPVTVLPGKPALAEIQVPARVRVKEAFPVEIKLRDGSGNLATSAKQFPGDLALRDEAGLLDPAILQLSSFEGASHTVRLVAHSIGQTRLVAEGTVQKVRGFSNRFTVTHGKLDHFTVELPGTVVAGEPFEVVVRAFDAQGNRVLDYAQTGRGVEMSSIQGGQVIVPYPLDASQFVDGILRFKPTVFQSGPLKVLIQEKGSTEQGTSEPGTVFTSAADRFEVSAPSLATAGRPFLARIRALDRYGNLIADYDQMGVDVKLTTNMSGNLEPNVIHASQFEGGTAEVTLMYDRAENFTITAGFATGPAAEMGPMRVPLPGMRMMDSTPSPAPLVEASPETGPPGASRQAGQSPPSSERTDDRASSSSGPAKRVPKPVVAESPRPAASPPSAAGAYMIRGDVSYREKGNEARLRFRTTGLINCRVSSEVDMASEWLRIVLWPVQNKVSRNLNFISSIFGEKRIEQDGDRVNLMLEILPSFSHITHRVERSSRFVEIVFAVNNGSD